MGIPLEQTPGARGLLPPTVRHDVGSARPRIVVIDDNAEMVSLLRDVLADDYELGHLPGPPSITSIDAARPDVMLIGATDGRSGVALTSAEIASLAARHARLQHVPIVALTADPGVLPDAERLTTLGGVTVVPLPFDVETIRCVLKSIVRTSVSR